MSERMYVFRLKRVITETALVEVSAKEYEEGLAKAFDLYREGVPLSWEEYVPQRVTATKMP